MKVSWLKLIWWVVIVATVVLVIRAHWFQNPDAETPKLVETAPVSVEVPIPAPAEIRPQPVSPPAKIRPQTVRLDCSWIPNYAYNYSWELVSSNARSRGLSPSKIRQLKACWEKHHG